MGLNTEADELPRGSELQAGVRVDLAIIFDPIGEHCKDCVGIMQDVEASVIALEGFDEALRDAVAFGTADRCEEQGQAESARDVGSVLGDVNTSVVGQPVDWMWRACAFEPALDGGDHEIAYHLAGDTGVRHGRPGDDLAVAGIEHEQDPDDLAIPGVQLEMIRAPSDIRVQRDDNPIMRAVRTTGGMAFECQSVVLHDPEHPLHVDRGLASAA